MTELHFFCAVCGRSLRAARRCAGELAECDACHSVVPVPGFAPSTGAAREWLPAFGPGILAIEIKFRCHGCRSKLRGDLRWEGRRLKCPHCGFAGRVPRWSAAPAPPAATAPLLSAAEVDFLTGGDEWPAAESATPAGALA